MLGCPESSFFAFGFRPGSGRVRSECGDDGVNGVRLRGILLGLASFALGPALAESPTESHILRVDPQSAGCSDATGTPYCSIQSAIEGAASGTTVELAPGNYDLWGESLSIEKDLNLRGAGADKTVLDGGGQHPEPLITISKRADEVHIGSLSIVNRIRTGPIA